MHSASLSFAGAAAPIATRVRAPVMETVEDLKVLAQELNPTVGYYNPTSLAEMEFWGQSQEATIGWLRHAEIKHGRVAMAAFVGYIFGANKVAFPWDIAGGPLAGTGPFADVSGGSISFSDIANAGSPMDRARPNFQPEIITAAAAH